MTGKELRERRLRNNLTQDQLFEKSGVPQATIARIESKEMDTISKVETLNKLTQALNDYESQNVDRDKSGISHKFHSDEFTHEDKTKQVARLKHLMKKAAEIHSNPSENVTRMGIPMYNEPAAAGAVEIYSDVREDQPAFFVNIPQFRDCDFGKMIFGHSMYPTYENGSYLFMKKQSGKSILPGEVYYIETGDYKIVKRLQLGNDENEFLAESDNTELRVNGKRKFETFPIKKEEILRLCLVKGSLKQSQN